MIERKFIAEKMKEFQIQEFISNSIKNVGHSHTKVQRTPLGEKIIIFASRPGLVVGRKGENIKKLTSTLKKKFDLEDPQIEISEVGNIFLDAQIVAEIIASTLERFGAQRFKGIGHKMMQDVMNAGALGIEIIISGKIPGARAKSWRFYQGYLKKCGDVALGVRHAYTYAQLKPGTVGVQVRIMPPDIVLPDRMIIREASPAGEAKPEEKNAAGEEKKEVSPAAAVGGEKKEEEKKKPARKRAPRKTAKKAEKKEVETEGAVEEK